MKTILIATDFSDAAANAVHYGADLAAFLGARIILAHAFSLPVGGYDSMAPLNIIGEMQTASHDALRECRKDIEKRLNRSIDIEIIAEPGAADALITELVDKHQVNLVVMGLVGHAGAVKKHIVGSTVLDAIRELHVPVLVVPQDVSYKKIDNIIFAADPDPDEDMTVFFAAKSFAEVFGASLEVLTVMPEDSSEATAEATRSIIDNNLRSIAHKTTLLRSNDVAATLENYIAAHHSSLVLLHPRRHSLWARLFETGITSRLLYSLKTPVMTFHS